MTAFTIFYGVIYFLIWLLIYKQLIPDWSWWAAALVSLVGVIALHLLLVLFGYISMRRHKAKKKTP